MGAYSPLPWAPPDLVDEVLERVLQPTVDEMRHRGTHFAGVLYAGLALTKHGTRVIEFNARFGDPETQVVLARLSTPLAPLLLAAATGRLDQHPPLVWDDSSAVTVVVAVRGLPGGAGGRRRDRRRRRRGGPAGGDVARHRRGPPLGGWARPVHRGDGADPRGRTYRRLRPARSVSRSGGAQFRSDIARAAAAEEEDA